MPEQVRRQYAVGAVGGALLGGAAGGLIGVLLGTTLTGLFFTLAGLAAGALIGPITTAAMRRDDWEEPRTDRPYVGAHAPDDDLE
jgi:predicted lipid-binding transport protein (Tim44 family)